MALIYSTAFNKRMAEARAISRGGGKRSLGEPPIPNQASRQPSSPLSPTSLASEQHYYSDANNIQNYLQQNASFTQEKLLDSQLSLPSSLPPSAERTVAAASSIHHAKQRSNDETRRFYDPIFTPDTAASSQKLLPERKQRSGSGGNNSFGAIQPITVTSGSAGAAARRAPFFRFRSATSSEQCDHGQLRDVSSGSSEGGGEAGARGRGGPSGVSADTSDMRKSLAKKRLQQQLYASLGEGSAPFGGSSGGVDSLDGGKLPPLQRKGLSKNGLGGLSNKRLYVVGRGLPRRSISLDIVATPASRSEGEDEENQSEQSSSDSESDAHVARGGRRRKLSGTALRWIRTHFKRWGLSNGERDFE